MGVSSHDPVSTIIEKWGKPHEGIGEEGFYCLVIPVNEENDFIMSISYKLEDDDLYSANQFYGDRLYIELKPENI